jgi:hypothetical protein
MLTKALVMTVAMTLGELPRDVLESFYWDCDTMFMRGELGGQDMYTCLQITEEFQKTFKDKEAFKQYWNEQKQQQWLKRGYQDQKGLQS